MDARSIIYEINSRLPFYNVLAKDLYEKTAEETAAHERRMKWWREARFGMFIHWGLYSVAAGKWNGISIPHYGEWIMHNAQIPDKKYSRLAGKFNPLKFNAGEWVSIAKNAGMKYIVITAKHHEGFSLYHTKMSKYNMVDATPFGHDVIAELARECSKQGIRFGLYYSQLDWHHAISPNFFGLTINFDKYYEFMKGQIKELLSGYGDICELFFDGDWMLQWNMKLGAELEQLCRSLQPDVIINNRIGKRPILVMIPAAARYTMQTTCGDYETPEQFFPDIIPNRDWESNITMNDTFGYKENDNNWKTSTALIRNLIEIVSRNGNFLLNVGPTGEGAIPEPSVKRLSEIGDWMRINGDSINGAKAGPIQNQRWGRSTRKPGKVFLHIFNWPRGVLRVDGIDEYVKKAYLLSDRSRKPLKIEHVGDSLNITLPEKAPDRAASVVVMMTG